MVSHSWINRDAYPFEPHYLNLDAGQMHYVDEGTGPTLLMVHGTPTWSFLYRHLIKSLSTNYRVIAPDHLGSGLSEKPRGFGYRPANHAANLEALIEALDLKDITLVVHDFGGPIGLSYALDHPENIRRIVIFNTWMWSLQNQQTTAMVARILGSPFGKFLYRHMDVEFRVIIPSVFADKSKLTPELLTHYKGPFEDDYATTIAWIYARELLGSTAWFESLWARRETLRDIPALLLWGEKDTAFGAVHNLTRWQSVFAHVQTVTFPDTGHFVQEEQGEALVPIIESFLRDNR